MQPHRRNVMPRPLLIRSEIHPYHIATRCLNKDFFPLPLKEVWEIMLGGLMRAHLEQGLAIHGFVLMGNHFHLLCHTPKGNLDQVMQAFLRQTSLLITRRAEKINGLWEGRYKWSLIDSQAHYYQVYRYIFQNPLRVGLVTRVEDYPYSTLRQEPPFPLHSWVPMAFAGKEGESLWLNEKYSDEDRKLIKLGLRKNQFDVNKRKLKAFQRLTLPKEES